MGYTPKKHPYEQQLEDIFAGCLAFAGADVEKPPITDAQRVHRYRVWFSKNRMVVKWVGVVQAADMRDAIDQAQKINHLDRREGYRVRVKKLEDADGQ